MAINRVDYPANLTAQADFSAHGTLIETRYLDQVNAPQWVVSGNIPQGVVLQIGGVVYRADSDTAITGTASNYVQVTPSGATASAAYVANLTGVTWSAQYNGYYDASENLYLFDEGKALAAGQISAVFGRYLMQQPNGDVAVGRNLDVDGAATVGGTLGVTGNTTVSGTLDVDGTTELDGLNVDGASTLDAVTMSGPLSGQHGNFLKLDSTRGRTPAGYYFKSSTSTENEIFDALAAAIPNASDSIMISGGFSGSGSVFLIAVAERLTTTTMRILLGGNAAQWVTITDGSTGSFGNDVVIVW